MTIDEILIELSLIHRAPSGPAVQLQAELLHQRRSSLPSPLACARRALAAALVRAGVSLDPRAGDRILRPSAN